MKTYDEECKELLAWEREKYKALCTEFPPNGRTGFDGPHTEKSQELFKEFMEKLRYLKKKYDIEQN